MCQLGGGDGASWGGVDGTGGGAGAGHVEGAGVPRPHQGPRFCLPLAEV